MLAEEQRRRWSEKARDEQGIDGRTFPRNTPAPMRVTGRPVAIFLGMLSLWVACMASPEPVETAPGPQTVEPPEPGTPEPTVTTIPAPEEPETVEACGVVEVFDGDGDGISDAVEEENLRKAFMDLRTGRCDEDPSEALGRPNRGRLKGGLNLPDRGAGYYHFLGTDAADTDDWGSLALVACLEAVGRRLAKHELRLGVGDLGLREGGRFPPHASHQNGLDVDLRYMRRDRRRIPLDLRFSPGAYDAAATKLVLDAFFDSCSVDLVFVDTDRLAFDVGERPVFHANGHSNHIHVRLAKVSP